LNRLGQVPAKGLPDFAVHSGLQPIDSRRLALEPVSRIDCGFRNLSSLGLLSGFQRPSRLYRLPCCATVLLDLTAFNQRGSRFILNRFRCQAAVAASLFRFTSKRILPLCRREAEPTVFRFSCQLASSTRFFPPAARLSPA